MQNVWQRIVSIFLVIILSYGNTDCLNLIDGKAIMHFSNVRLLNDLLVAAYSWTFRDYVSLLSLVCYYMF